LLDTRSFLQEHCLLSRALLGSTLWQAEEPIPGRKCDAMKYCPGCHRTYPTDYNVCPADQTSLQSAHELQPGMVIRNKYEILKQIGIGGMGFVYRARYITFNEVCAIKIVNDAIANDANFLQRFQTEAVVTRKLRHPNAVRVEDYDYTEDGRPFIVMEFVEGKNVGEILQEEGPMPAPRAICIAAQVTRALGFAHKIGIVHRDIKPGNIILTTDEQGLENAKVLDFGIAKLKDAAGMTKAGMTMTGMVVGTPLYMSPEQFMGKKTGEEIDGRTDLYSLGIVLYQMVTARLPFPGETLYSLMMQHIEGNARPPHELTPELQIPESLSRVILKAIDKSRELRYQTADELIAALDQVSHELAWSDRDAATAAASLPAASIAPSPSGVQRSAVRTPPFPPSAVIEAGPRRSTRARIILIGCSAVALTTLLLWLWLQRTPTRTLSLPSGDMVLVNAGVAPLGADQKPMMVESFYIDKTEVTNQAFLAFCRETNSPIPPGADLAPADNPVINVTYDEAQAFARWARKRLPTAIEWEKAARGAKGLTYPWGDTLDYNLANIPRDSESAEDATLSPAASYSAGASPYGVLNMVGNASEWIEAPAAAPAGDEFTKYQSIFRDLTPPLSPTEPFYQVRGGSYRFVLDSREEAARLLWDSTPVPARARKPDIGFRCAKSLGR
jgi:serine/threonine protein kinase/formylglycine-generating enzyme required for sulfatase activity